MADAEEGKCKMTKNVFREISTPALTKRSLPPGIPRRPPTASSADRSVKEAARITGLLHVITIPPDGDGDGGGFSVIFKEIDIVAPHLPIPRMFSKEQAEASFAS